jgi:hypothetical protein
VGIEMRDRLNLDMITWECDYPHSDSTWPQAPETVARYLQDLPEEDVAKITHLNAMRIFHFDPFSIRPKERCTAQALRSEVPDHDISIVSHGLRRHETSVQAFNQRGVVEVGAAS